MAKARRRKETRPRAKGGGAKKKKLYLGAVVVRKVVKIPHPDLLPKLVEAMGEKDATEMIYNLLLKMYEEYNLI
jgi:hypothetical protein